MLDINKKTDDGFYKVGWAVIIAAALLGVLVKATGLDPLRLLRPCVLHALTGYYCPGCGGTRAVLTLLNARPLRSFFYHPFVLYAAVISGWFMVSQTIERVSGGRIRIGMHFREIYVWIALGIILLNFLIKNLALIIWNIDMLAVVGLNQCVII